jgi:hypothetical protein
VQSHTPFPTHYLSASNCKPERIPSRSVPHRLQTNVHTKQTPPVTSTWPSIFDCKIRTFMQNDWPIQGSHVPALQVRSHRTFNCLNVPTLWHPQRL